LYQKIILTKLVDGFSVEFLFRKNQADAIIDFDRHFCFFSNHLFFPKINNIFELKSIYRTEKILFSDFCQNIENKKSKTHHLGLWRHFNRFSETVFHKILVLLSTTEHGRIF
jgi:hypothetical protein